MATNRHDQDLVAKLAQDCPERIIPCFGWHPWHSHEISFQDGVSKEDHYKSLLLGSKTTPKLVSAFEKLLPRLPEPVQASSFLSQLRTNLIQHPNAMLGEVGLDKIYRVRFPPDPEGKEEKENEKSLSPFTVPMDHQIALIEAQIAIAVELKRNISLHSVRAPQATVDLFNNMHQVHGDKWRMVNVDVHSCTLSPDVWEQQIEKLHPNVYLSLSTVINVQGRSDEYAALIQCCSPNRILVESDFDHIGHCAQRTWDMVGIVAQLKGWTIEDEWVEDDDAGDNEGWGVVRRLHENWKAFSRS